MKNLIIGLLLSSCTLASPPKTTHTVVICKYSDVGKPHHRVSRYWKTAYEVGYFSDDVKCSTKVIND